jgi:nucleotide-binding universal stress UspA family protein
MTRIVVGADGSPGSRLALTEALSLARRLEAEVDAVWAWHMSYGGVEYGVAPIISREELEIDMRNALSELVGGVDTDGVVVHQIVVEGDATRALLDAAKGADMLVVGSRGHGGLFGLVLGSVSYKCISHATSPVLVVPAPQSAEG